MSRSKQLEQFDRQKGPSDFRNAGKQPWECETYAEFLASLPDDEQPTAPDYDDE